MKRGLFRILLLAAIVAAVAVAAVYFSANKNVKSSGECGPELTWTLYKNDELVISGEGEMTSWSQTNLAPWYEFEVKNVIIESGVTSIGAYAFQNSRIAGVQISSTVKAIGEGAFSGCAVLPYVYVPSTVTDIGKGAFSGCTALSRINIPEGITVLADSVFSGCSALAEVNIPDTVTEIGDHAFYGCAVLPSVTLPDGIVSIGSSAFSGCSLFDGIVIPKGVTSLGDRAFENCTSLSKISFMTSDVALGSEVFASASAELVILGYPQSTAQAYALENGNTFELFGMQFAAATISLLNDLAVNFKVNKEAFDEIGYTLPYVVFEFDDKSYTQTAFDVEKMLLNGEETEVYVFAFRNLAPDRMNDIIKATLHASYNGAECEGRAKEYSVTQYCYNQLGSCTGKTPLSTMCVDLLNYGAAAQEYMGYRTDALANAELTDEQKSWGTSEDRALVDHIARDGDPAEEKAVWMSANLKLRENITVELKFLADDITGLYVWVEMYGQAFRLDDFQYDEQNGWYVVEFGNFSAMHMSDLIKAAVHDAAGNTVSKTLTYSVESYAQRMQDDPAVGKLVKAMMKYGDAVVAYSKEY